MRWLFGLFLVAHGLVHMAIWMAPATRDAPFAVRRGRWSWRSPPASRSCCW
jgi:hypothetical protein